MKARNSNRIFSTSFILLVTFVQAIILSSCMHIGTLGGAGDWTYADLPGSYEIWRMNTYEIALVMRSTEYTADNVVESYVSEIAWNSEYIFAKQKPESNSLDSEISFYIVDVDSTEVYGPLSQSEFDNLIDSMDITFAETDWINTEGLKP